MTVRCAQCGQENNPQYRFCGMCGAPLSPAPVQAAQARERARVPVSGPSFLGLGDEHSRDLDYLLEDEPPRGHGRLYFALVLLLISAGLLAWHWQRDGYPWAGLIQKPATSAPAVAAAPAPPPQASSPPAVIPVEPTANPAPPETQSSNGETTQSGAGESPASTAAPASPAVKPVEPTAQSNDNAANNVAAGKTPAVESAQTNTAEITKPEQKEPPVTPKKVAPTPLPTAAAATFEDRLVADGERYLYGRGVPEDCERAQRNLQIAARQSNAKAQTLLGAMYATGHCVGRDLPNSYRWFAKALHGDPGNSRVQRDLEVLWKQMTPEERLLAMKN
jgi:Double zinc ribbon/Sel1 repeat